MLIRPAHTTDAAAIASLATELGYPAVRREMESRLAVLQQRDTYFIAVAEVESGVVGWIAAEHRLILESGDRAEIVGLVVSGAHRRLGIGARLVAAAEVWVKSRGLEAISVRSNVARNEAHPFYENRGYTRTKTQHAYIKRLRDG